MFKRIIYDNWTDIVPILSFWLTFGVFIGITIRALLFKKDYVNHMGSMPLEDDPNNHDSTQA
ncbi:MAG: cbb3-type cytochrome c oxidase subunit 3 [Verrucomicrobiota bacterium]